MKYSVLLPALAAVLCGVAMLPGLSYGFFTLLRLVVCVAAVVLAVALHSNGKTGAAVVFVAIALLFNPFVKVRLKRAEWRFIDGAVALVMVGGAVNQWKRGNHV